MQDGEPIKPVGVFDLVADWVEDEATGTRFLSTIRPHHGVKVRNAMKGEPLDKEEILVLVRRAGLELNPAQLDELVEAYGLLQNVLSRVHQYRSSTDEPAHVFRPARHRFPER